MSYCIHVMCHIWHIACHVSYMTYCMSYVIHVILHTCHVSYMTCHMSYMTYYIHVIYDILHVICHTCPTRCYMSYLQRFILLNIYQWAIEYCKQYIYHVGLVPLKYSAYWQVHSIQHFQNIQSSALLFIRPYDCFSHYFSTSRPLPLHSAPPRLPSTNSLLLSRDQFTSLT